MYAVFNAERYDHVSLLKLRVTINKITFAIANESSKCGVIRET